MELHEIRCNITLILANFKEETGEYPTYLILDYDTFYRLISSGEIIFNQNNFCTFRGIKVLKVDAPKELIPLCVPINKTPWYSSKEIEGIIL